MIPLSLRIGVGIITVTVLPIDVGAAQYPKQPPARAEKPETTSPRVEDAQPKKPTPAQLEQEFQETLRGATLEGVWQMTGEGGLRSTAPLTEPKPDQYAISSATKIKDDQWIISARIQFADKDVTVPVPVRVVWAEDTAIITLNDLSIPMIGSYSARVMIHHGFYSGVWYSNEKNYGGVMQGRIVKRSPPSAEIKTDPKPASP